MSKLTPLPEPTDYNVESLFNEACTHYQAGRLREAETYGELTLEQDVGGHHGQRGFPAPQHAVRQLLAAAGCRTRRRGCPAVAGAGLRELSWGCQNLRAPLYLYIYIYMYEDF